MADRVSPAEIAVVVLLTAIAFALRLVGIDQTLFGDELFTYAIVTGNDGVGGVLGDGAHTTESNPPLYYVLAWLAAQVGDPTIWIRIPSLVFGTATVPLVYLLGARTVGRSAGLVGAALVALSPFAIFYSDEARAYAMLTCLSVLSTLTLLRALRRADRLSWVAYGASLTALIYTHYTGVFVVLAQLGWAAWTHREHLRALALVSLGVAVAFLPWLPSFIDQQDLSAAQGRIFTRRFPLTVDTVLNMFGRVFPGAGEPSFLVVPLREVPGRGVVAVVWVALGATVIAAIVRQARRPPAAGSNATRPMLALLVALALVTPLAMILYSAKPHTSWLLARNLSASLPAFALLVGWLLMLVRRPLAILALGVVLAALAVGAAKVVDDDYQRPPYRQAARFVDAAAAPHDPVIHDLDPLLAYAFGKPFKAQLKQPHESSLQPGVPRVFVVIPVEFGGGPARYRRDHLGAGYSLARHHVYPGLVRVGAFEFVRKGVPVEATLRSRTGGDVVLRPGQAPLPVAHHPDSGSVDAVVEDHDELTVGGWAVDPATRRPSRLVLLFSDGRLVVAGRASIPRPDIAALLGNASLRAGYRLTAIREDAHALARPGRLKVVAISGRRAWALTIPGQAFEGGG
jgi:Dolichyl-phosphate-mannose-protein mannosyltransferase